MTPSNSWNDIFPESPNEPHVPAIFDPELLADRPAPEERTAAQRAVSGPNQATELVQLARAKYDVVRGKDGKTYAVAHALPGVAFGLRGSGGLHQQLAAAYFNDKGRAASGSALQDARAVLEGDALHAEETPVHLRVGRHNDAIIIDRATPTGHAIKVTAKGWELLAVSPILFRRSGISMAMPAPERGGDLEALRALLNLDEQRFRLVVAWMLAALIPDIPHPILALSGQQGTAKTTAARIILSFVDRSAAGLISQPKNEESWAVSASNIWGIGLDNVSSMQPWLQDALCKAVTGDAFVRRELYSDDSLTVLRFLRPIALTTIDPGALQGDVADRLLLIELSPINTTNRRTEADIEEAIESIRASATGTLLDLLADVLRTLPSTKLDEKPRMADFALLLAALDTVTGWTTLRDYLAATNIAARDVLDGDSFGSALRNMVIARGYWQGTGSDLREILNSDSHRDHPANPRGVSGRLSRLAPALAAAKISVFKHEHSRIGITYTISHDLAPKCTVCELPIHPETAKSGVTTHPTCVPPTYLEEVSF